MDQKPSNQEDEYFAREDALKKAKIAQEQSKLLAVKEKDELKKLHWMRCPKCGMELQAVAFRGIEIDRCFHCNGTWLDEGELEKLAGEESQSGAVMRTVLNLFKTK